MTKARKAAIVLAAVAASTLTAACTNNGYYDRPGYADGYGDRGCNRQSQSQRQPQQRALQVSDG